jgi:RHS repeat-associated protein
MNRILSAAFLLVFFAAPLMAQDFQAGIVPYGAYDEQGFDNIGLSNGNLILTIPLMSYPQKGTLPDVGYSLISNDPDWVQNCNTDDQGNTYCDWELDNNARFGPKPVPNNELWKVPCGGCDPLGVWTNVIDSTGAAYTAGPLNSNWTPYFTMDGSGYVLNSSGITDRNGILHGATKWTDPSGNTVTVLSGGYAGQGGYTDSFGRSIPAPPATCAPAGICGTGVSSPGCYETGYPANYGGTAPFTFCFENITYSSDIGTADDPNNQCSITEPGTAQALVLQSVTLPNGASWQFGYDSTGDIQSVTTPTGGTVMYAWETQPGGTQCGYDGEVFNRWVQTRTVNAVPGNPAYAKTWTYSYTPSFAPTTVTDPDGNYTVWNLPGGQTKYYGSSSNLLKTITTQDFTYYNSSSGSYASYQSLPELVTTTWGNGQVSATCTIWDQNTNTSCVAGQDAISSSAQYFYYPYTYIHVPIIYGSKLFQYDYDYGNGSYGSVLHKTATQYQWQNSSNYQAANLLDLVASVQILNAGGAQAAYTSYNYDEAFSYTGCSSGPCGNQTSVHQWLSGSTTATPNCGTAVNGGYLVSYKTYNAVAQMTSSVDSCGSGATDASHMTTYGYSPSCPGGQGWAGTAPTSVANPLGQTTSSCYDLSTGLVTSETDENSQTTSYSYDSSNRMTSIGYSDGGQVMYTYTDTTPNPYYVFQRKINSSTNFTEKGTADGFGRLIQTQVTVPAATCSGGYSYSDITYDDLGRTASISNSYCATSDPTYGVTLSQYDPLGRTIQTTDQDGSKITTSYSGNSTTVTDEAGAKRETFTDGVGRLIEVIEDPSGFGYVTTYNYDALDNLSTVTQVGSRQRAFVHDSLSRLTSATDPESGTVSYAYDANGNVVTKTSPQPNQSGGSTVTISYMYDTLSRVTQKTYSTGPGPTDFQYYYDAAGHGYSTGRLTHASNNINAAFDPTYDPMGRVTNISYCIPSDCTYDKNISTTYDLAGDVVSYTNAAGVTITQAFDSAMQLAQITSSLIDAQHPGTLATFSYFPSGLAKSVSYANGLTGAAMFNNRLQPCRANVNSSGGVFGTCTDSIPSGTLLDFGYSWNAGSADNGNLYGWSAAGQQTFNRTYAYDTLNRLQSMADSDSVASCQGLTWTYDAWANRTAQTPTKGTCGAWSSTYTANNQISGYSYDAAGNLLYDGQHSYTYNAENRITAVDGGSTAAYVYDALGQRVSKTANGLESDYILDASGNIRTVFGDGCGTGCWAAGYTYANGGLISVYGNSTTYFASRDHLGSTRLWTSLNQSIYDSLDYLPFGEITSASTDPDPEFTGKQRDSESNLDNFGARYYGSALGRFMSVDPTYESEILELPQTWNRYAYVYDRPVNLTDPNGECPPCIGALIGGAIEGSVDLAVQLSNNGGHISQVSWKEVGANAAGGAVTGALAGSTGGLSLLGSAVAGDAFVSVSSGVIGGTVTHALEGSGTTASDVSGDVVSSLVGGTAGRVASDLVHVPEEPVLRRRASARAKQIYQAREAARAEAIVNQQIRAGLASSVVGHFTTIVEQDATWQSVFTPGGISYDPFDLIRLINKPRLACTIIPSSDGTTQTSCTQY